MQFAASIAREVNAEPLRLLRGYNRIRVKVDVHEAVPTGFNTRATIIAAQLRCHRLQQLEQFAYQTCRAVVAILPIARAPVHAPKAGEGMSARVDHSVPQQGFFSSNL